MADEERGSSDLARNGPRTPAQNNEESDEGHEPKNYTSKVQELLALQASDSTSDATHSPPAPTPSRTIASIEDASTLRKHEHVMTQAVEDASGATSEPVGMAIKHRRKSSATPNLTLQIGEAMSKPRHETPITPESPASLASRLSPMKSPLSPRTRDRGFSLRRSILARNIHGHPESSGSVVKLQTMGQSASQSEGLYGGRNLGKKPDASINFSPIIEQVDDLDLLANSTKKIKVPSALPHYETFLTSESSRCGLLATLRRIKERIRRKLLRIQEIPPSKDGRHLDLDPTRNKPLTDDRTGRVYIDNTILSSKYTCFNFLPRQLFAQFSKLANFYFLCVSILQMIPGLSTTGTYTTIVPLMFFVCISMAKEGYDDFRRYRLDKAENSRTAFVLHAEKSRPPSSGDDTHPSSTAESGHLWVDTKWQDIRVGDVISLKRDDVAPADLIVLHSLGIEDNTYVETMALDGETNLKSKHASPPLARNCQTPDGIAHCRAHLVVEDPNLDLYKFEGKVTLGDETLPLTNNEIIYRGSVLRNTLEAVGLVIYTGEECKIRMNATKNPRIKAPSLQAAVNKVVIVLVVFVFALAIFNTVAYQIWQESTEEKAWYLTDAGVAFFPILISFVILFNTMIPLSLYISLEIVKLFQMLLLNDVDMYDDASNTPMEARTSTINEELGQVNYVFSDKTGTLTNNSMRFRKISVAGTAWLHDPDLRADAVNQAAQRCTFQKKPSKRKKPMRRKNITSRSIEMPVETFLSPTSNESPMVRNDSTTSRWRSSARLHTSRSGLDTTEMLQYIQNRPHSVFARKACFFLLSLALCNTCIPEKTKDGDIEYQSASPDEQALVRAAQELGYIMLDRKNGNITIKSFPSGRDSEPVLETYQVLDVIEFSSTRKRMSIIVRMPDQQICVFCKGADSTLIQLLRHCGLAIAKATEIEQRVNKRQNFEAQEAIRRQSEAKQGKDSFTRKSMSIHRPSIGAIGRPSMTGRGLQPIRDEVDHWLHDRETDFEMSAVDSDGVFYTPRPSAHYGQRAYASLDGRLSHQSDDRGELVEEALVVDDAAVFERCFQHINDFATEGLRTLLYCYRYMSEDEYKTWKKMFLDASTSLENRQEMIDTAGAAIERDFELTGATAIEDKLQAGVPEAIDKLRRAKIKLWMLTGDKRETAINVGHSCRLIKDYSSIIILDQELGDVSQRIAAAIIDMNESIIAHSVVIVDGYTLSLISVSESLRNLFLDLAILVDTVICCRASPSQKAFLVTSIRHKVKNAITLAIGDGANDIAMIQEAHVGIGITGKEGLQAARTSDYSIAQFRFLTKLLLVHGRWNYIRVCKYTLGTFWKEMLFYLTQALYQRWAGYTGTSLYESWSLSMFNTLFTSLPVIFLGIFEQDLCASTLLAVPELYHSLGHRNGGFNFRIYLGWVALAASQAIIVFFVMLGIFGQTIFTLDNGLYAMGDLTFTACIIVIATKIQFWEIHNKTYTCAISIFISIGGWFLWNIILSSIYSNNVIYNVKDGFLDRFGRNALWWLTLILIVVSCWALEVGIKAAKFAWMPSDADVFSELQKDPAIKKRFEQAAEVGLAAHASYGSSEDTALQPVRTAEEERQREGEVQEMLDRPRHSGLLSGDDPNCEGVTLKKRRHSEREGDLHDTKPTFAVTRRAMDHDDDDNEIDDNGNERPRRKSANVHELLRRGFASARRSLDIV